MLKKWTAVVCMLGVIVTTTNVGSPAWAQAPGSTSGEKGELTGTRKQIATIVFAGLSGAILGLSTLSFYGRPQDHLSNIAVGFAFGVIGGAIYTTYKAATRPYEAYDLALSFEDEAFKRSIAMGSSQSPTLFTWTWEL